MRVLYENAKSGVTSFELFPDAIIVEFKSGTSYLYSTEHNDIDVIDKMKQLAQDGVGLSSFITRSKPKFVKLIQD